MEFGHSELKIGNKKTSPAKISTGRKDFAGILQLGGHAERRGDFARPGEAANPDQAKDRGEATVTKKPIRRPGFTGEPDPDGAKKSKIKKRYLEAGITAVNEILDYH